jgi:hypothetical protein
MLFMKMLHINFLTYKLCYILISFVTSKFYHYKLWNYKLCYWASLSNSDLKLISLVISFIFGCSASKVPQLFIVHTSTIDYGSADIRLQNNTSFKSCGLLQIIATRDMQLRTAEKNCDCGNPEQPFLWKSCNYANI